MSETWIENSPPLLRLTDLNGGVAVVTGASRGIGAAVVAALQRNGVFCIGLAHQFDTLEPAANWLPLVCNLRDAAALHTTIETIAARVEAVDYLVNVAGIDPRVPLEEGDETLWHEVMDLNLRAYYLMIRACLPLLQRGTGKSIVNVSSINYRIGVEGRSIYSTSKAGILGLTTGLARELGKQGIRINTVSPGWVFTERQVAEYFAGNAAERHLRTVAERQALRIKIQPMDIANHILFYLSAVSRASTGHNLVIDGGWLLE